VFCDHAVRIYAGPFMAQVWLPATSSLRTTSHNGGGLALPGFVVQRPVFVERQLVGWAVNSGHMIGYVAGWHSVLGAPPGGPPATDCYQKLLRLPPVRLFLEDTPADVWAIVRNTIRVSSLSLVDNPHSSLPQPGGPHKLSKWLSRGRNIPRYRTGLAEPDRSRDAPPDRLLEDGEYA